MSNKLVVLVLGGALTIAAFAGGYVALRRNAAESVVQAETRSATPAAAPAIAADTPQSAQPEPLATTDVPVSASAPADRPARKAKPAKTVRSGLAAAKPVELTNGSSTASAATAPTAAADAPVAEAVAIDSAAPPEPPRPRVEELTVAPDSVIGIRLDTTISSETARVEDRVSARVIRDVVVSGRTAISAGAKLEGVVTTVERGSKFRDRSRIGVRFQALVLADGTRLPIQTETISREGESPTAPAASKIGASAAIGGILGALLGGKKGAAIGSTVGAAGGTAAVMQGDTNTVFLQAGTPLTVRLTAPLMITIEKQEDGALE